MEQRLLDQIAQVSVERFGKHAAKSCLLEEVKAFGIQLRIEMVSLVREHEARSEEYAAGFESVMQQLRDQITRASAEHDTQHDANQGRLLDNPKAHKAKPEEYADSASGIERLARDQIDQVSAECDAKQGANRAHM